MYKRQIYDRILQRSDLSSAQWVEVGVGLYNSENFGDAATSFGKAREGNPFSKEGMENFVNASIQAGRPGPVIALADTLVKWYPYDATSYQLHASALARADMEDRAMEVMGEGQQTGLVFHFVQMAPSGDGTYEIQGSFETRTATGMLAIPFEFLDIVKRIETMLGRSETREKNQPRTIDIDILLHGDAILETEELTLPHPMLGLRKFVLLPFDEIASNFQIPHLNITVKDMLARCPDTSTVAKHRLETQA